MMFITRSIAGRIGLLSLLPIVGILLLGSLVVVKDVDRARKARTVADTVAFAPDVSALVHDLQKERGTTAGFISSKGKAFADTIGARRSETDQSLATFRASLAKVPAADHDGPLAATVERAVAALDRLGERRRVFDAFGVAAPESSAYYTDMIADLLRIVEGVDASSLSRNIQTSFAAYTALLHGKERAGQERAAGSSGFSAGQFTAQGFTQFVRLGAMQETYFAVFARNASDAQRDAFNAIVAPGAQADYEQQRKTAYEAPFGGSLAGISGPNWFETSTRRLDAIKRLEDGIAAALVAEAAAIAHAAWRDALAEIVVMLVFVIGVSVATWQVARSVSVPIHRLSKLMGALAQNDTRQDVPYTTRQDEVGAIARAVEIFRENAVTRLQLERESQSDRDRELHRQSHIDKIVTDFRNATAALLDDVGRESGTMLETAERLNRASREATNGAAEARSASDDAARNVQAVAASTEQLAGSIREIAAQTQRAQTIVGSAEERTRSTERDMGILSDASDRIGTVIGLIRQIAEQTNLLALNATIEAARAGEMGRGFAIVATEVKTLANQTSKATEEIAHQISALQASSRAAAESIRGISSTVAEINNVTAGIAAAVEEQQAATQDISDAAQRAARGTSGANKSTAYVADAMGETAANANGVNLAADRLTTINTTLAKSVEQFLLDVRQDVTERRKSLRVKMNQVVIITQAGRRLQSTMLDASTTGARLDMIAGLDPNSSVSVELADGTTARARIVRRDDTSFAIAFDEPLKGVRWLSAA